MRLSFACIITAAALLPACSTPREMARVEPTPCPPTTTPIPMPRKRLPKIELYVDAAGEFRWRLISTNGRILADGAEGYKQRHTVRRTAVMVAKAMAAAELIDLSGGKQ